MNALRLTHPHLYCTQCLCANEVQWWTAIITALVGVFHRSTTSSNPGRSTFKDEEEEKFFRRNFKIVNVIEAEVETTINQFVAYSLALDESTDRNDEAHLAIFIRGVNEHFTVSECLLDMRDFMPEGKTLQHPTAYMPCQINRNIMKCRSDHYEYRILRLVPSDPGHLVTRNECTFVHSVGLCATVIYPVTQYMREQRETWTLTLREEHRFRVFENKVLRKIFGAKRDEVTGEWRKLHNTELHALYSSPDIIRNIKSRRLRWAGHVARMGESRNAYRVLVGRPEGKRPLGRPRRRWEDNIKMDLREVGYDDRDWINLAQDRDRWRAYVRAAMNLRVP
ncbi:hypothetical protein ANN_24182 [Periplaneta americana]|uniref:Uncharacterized protein n=1 Tax=Periplaneta americana TaxID=6978 RepID=A0ABQ8S2R3_PERAM|nr:hypothetical protein ANN_24182 [Periplaneta americana]